MIFSFEHMKKYIYPSVNSCFLFLASFLVVAHSVSAQCNFTVSPSSATYGCYVAQEDAVFVSGSNVAIATNNITKSAGGNAWNAGAFSTARIYNNGYVETVANETNTARVIGLSNTNPDNNFTSILFGAYLRADATLEVFESGTSRGTYGAYVSGDTIRVKVEQRRIKYYRNSTLFYVSNTLTPSFPLFVDMSLFSTGATLQRIVIGNLSDGSFTATATTPGTGPTYQWKLNGTDVGTNSTTYSNTSLAVNDVVTCVITPGAGGCSVPPVTSNNLRITRNTSHDYGDFYITSTAAASGCSEAVEQVVWDSLYTNLRVTGNTLTKIQAGGAWNGGAASLNRVADQGYFQFTVTESTNFKAAGLSITDANSDVATIRYAFYLSNIGAINIYESNTNRGAFGAYTVGDVFKIAVESGVVKYYKNGTLLYISAVVPVLPLLADVSINGLGGVISNALISNYTAGSFTATGTNLGASPVYQWKLNGANVGTNSATYTNTSLTSGDVVTCVLTPSLTACAGSANLSNSITYQTLSPSPNIEFYVEGGTATSACNSTEEIVVWKAADMLNMQALSGNGLNKVQAGGAWNGGAASWNTVKNNGYLQFNSTETNTARMIGLSNTNLNADFTSIQYAFYLLNNSTLRIYESGVNIGNFGSYLSNDVFKIAVEAGVVKYYQNGNLLRTSPTAPTLPLLVDVSFNTLAATISDVVVGNYNTGTFNAVASNVGVSPTYQWKLNGSNVGTNSATYVNAGLANGDVVSCQLTPNLSGCSTSAYTSNLVTNNTLASPVSIDFYIEGTPAGAACNEVQEQVVWVNAGLANVVATTNNLNKTQSGGSWNGGANSWNIVYPNGYFQFTATEDDRRRMVGLSVNNVDNNFTSIDYAIYLVNTGSVRIYELGTDRGAVSTYLPGDVFKIAVEGTVVKYYQNGTLIYISAVAPYAPMQADVSIFDIGGTVTNAIIANYNDGTFNAVSTNAGASPTYQWKLNGVNVGTNSTTYVNASLAINDQVTCVLTPNIPGCGLSTYTSNTATNKAVSTTSSIEFYIQGTASTSSCASAEEQVVWRPVDLLNVEATGNNLVKIQSNGWNGGAASLNRVYNNGYVQFTATETNTARMLGLSDNALNANFTSIQYAIYLTNIGSVQIYESGTNRGTVDTYFPGDVFRIAVEGSVVKYYRNGAILFISNVAPTFPLLVDVSINTNGGTFTNVLVGNANTGTFTATASNAGATPAYQWKLNGANVGTNSTTYTNTSLVANDVVTCVLTPSIAACLTTYTSNTVTNKASTVLLGGDFYIEGTSVVSGCNYAEEAVTWIPSAFRNVYQSGTTLNKMPGIGGWNGGAASYNTVKDNGYMYFIATETNTNRVIGLDNINYDNSDTVRYAFHLRNDGSLRVREQGNDLGGFSVYFPGDTLKISVESSVVKYYQNSTLLYISNLAPTLPMLVDVSIGLNGTLSGVRVANYNSGTFTATATNVGVSPTYQWKLNGVDVGTNSTTYTNASLANNDVVTCVLRPNLGGCNAAAFASNTVVNKKRTVLGNVDFYIRAVGTSACNNTVEEQVKWKISDLTNTVQVEASNGLLRLQNGGTWNGGASSWNSVANNGYLEFTATETTTSRMVGLSTTSLNDNFNSIQYAFNLRSDGLLRISESGTNRGDFGLYVSGDVLRIAVESNIVRYYNNGSLLFQSAVVPTLPLVVDVSINSSGGTVGPAFITNFNTTTFNAFTVNAGGSPSYQWKLNGVNVGTNSATYTNLGLVANDVITCVMSTSVSGCGVVNYNSNIVTNKFSPQPTLLEFTVRSTPVVTSCLFAEEEVRWNLPSLSNVTATLNNVFKTTSNGNWNGEANSRNTVSNNGYFTFKALQTNRNRVAGLSNNATPTGQNTIQYGIFLRGTNAVDILESGVTRVSGVTTYALNDVFRIAVEANVVRYYKNGSLLYTSLVAPTLPLTVDVCINAVGGTVSEAFVANYTGGSFTATALNAGPAPVYQWKLNNVNVGTNSATYTNASVTINDIVSCVLTPDIPGCQLADVNSNDVTIKSTVTTGVIEFYVLGTAASAACLYSEEQVRWRVSDLVNVQANGNNLIKNTSNGSWDGGAASWNRVANNGYFEFTVSDIDKAMMVGLSNTNLNANQNNIQYAFHLVGNNVLRIYESGVDRGSIGTSTVGDVLRIAVEASVVKYYRNGVLAYISTVAPTLPLLVDVSINAVSGRVTNALVSNYNTGAFTATATGAGVAPSYQWKLNGANVGTNSTTYTNTALLVNDVVSCVMTPDFGSCSVPVNSNTLTSKTIPNPIAIDFYVTGTPAATACNTVEEQVQWRISSLSNVQATTNNLTKIQSNFVWDGGAASWNTVANNGYLQFTATEDNRNRFVGLSNTNIDATEVTIQYAFYLVNNSTYSIRESGVNRGTFGTYAPGDIFRIGVEASVVKYYKGSTLVYISTIAPTLPLLVDVSINQVGGTVTNAIVSNYNTGVFTATATGAGVSPTFQWKLNGTNVGTNSSSYTNTSLAVNDVITCVLTPSIGGCTGTTYTSNIVTNKAITNPIGIDFYIQGSVVAAACKTVEEQVQWRISSLSNVQATSNNLNKIQSNNAWDGGAASWNTVANNGYFQFIATEDNRNRYIGLSNTNVDATEATIQYAFFLVNNAVYSIRESGVNRGTFGTYAPGDIFRITVEAGIVKYYHNGVLDYISTIAPTLPLLVDVSINQVGGTVTNAIVSNYNTGTFTATATGAGVSPTFQWKLNGTNVGTNSSTYTNTTLAVNDVVSCVLTPSLGGCSSTTYTSNTITTKDVAQPIGIDFYIQGTPAVTACNTADEDVVWKITDLLYVTATGNDLRKVQSGNVWNGGAASWNTVANNGFVTFSTAEANTAKYVGLSTTNADATNTTIQYAIYLLNNGGVQVHESGTSRGSFGVYNPADVFKIAVESNVVKYYRNGTVFYISAVVPTLPLLVDVSINTLNGTVNDVVISNLNTGTFTATSINAGVAPSYQWKLNGSNVGTNSATYVNASLLANDIITCVLTPDLGGCNTTVYTSNAIVNKPVPLVSSIEFNIQGTAIVAPACRRAEESVVWTFASLSNVVATANSLNKIQSNGNWDGGAASVNTVKNNGYFQFTVSEINRSRVVGLSATNTDANFTSIQYGFNLTNSAVLLIVESNNNRGSFATYAVNDVLRIAVESGVVRYYRNGTLLYTSLVAPTLPLLVDVSINQVGGTVTNAVVSNLTAGAFVATATGAGATPSYQWRVNGVNVGTNSTTYTNAALLHNDVVTCILTPSAGGCGPSSTLASNSITNRATTITTQPVNLTPCLGTAATFSVAVTGSDILYQWRRNGTNIVGATSSTYTIPAVAAGDVANYDVLVNNAGCVSNVVTLTLAANNQWTGATSTAWATTTNWSCGILPTSTTDVVIPSPVVNMPTISATANVRNLTINASATLTNASTGILNVFGNFVDNGTYRDNGTTAFIGSTAQAFTGTGSDSLNNMTVNNAAGLTISSALYVKRYLTLTSGAVASGGNLTVDLYLGAILGTGTGSITGNINVLRTIWKDNWHYISSPLSGRTAADWNDDVLIKFGANANLYTYNETNPSPNRSVGWTAVPSIATSLTMMRGYALYFTKWVNRTVIDMTGTYNHAATYSDATLTNTSSGTPLSDGWNLVGNPYPSEIDWDAASGWTKTGLDNAIYFWDQSNNQYATYIAGVGLNGGSRYIPCMQGFYVKVTNPGTGTLGMTNSVRSSVINRDNWRVASDQTLIKLKVDNGTSRDETAIRLHDEATQNFDSELDAYKLPNEGITPSISTLTNNVNYAVNSIPEGTLQQVIPVKLIAGTTGSYTITADVTGFDDADSIVLFDKLLGVSQDLQLNPTYTCNLVQADTASRFYINYKKALKITDVANVENTTGISIYGQEQTVNVLFGPESNGRADLAVYDVTGALVYKEEQKDVTSGKAIINLQVPSGIYIVKAQSAGVSKTQQVFLSK
jgi:hypothetical protein